MCSIGTQPYWVISGSEAATSIVEVNCVIQDVDRLLCLTEVGVADAEFTENWLIADMDAEKLKSRAGLDRYACLDARYMAVNHAMQVLC